MKFLLSVALLALASFPLDVLAGARAPYHPPAEEPSTDDSSSYGKGKGKGGSMKEKKPYYSGKTRGQLTQKDPRWGGDGVGEVQEDRSLQTTPMNEVGVMQPESERRLLSSRQLTLSLMDLLCFSSAIPSRRQGQRRQGRQ